VFYPAPRPPTARSDSASSWRFADDAGRLVLPDAHVVSRHRIGDKATAGTDRVGRVLGRRGARSCLVAFARPSLASAQSGAELDSHGILTSD
jgi:hypothetical protein